MIELQPPVGELCVYSQISDTGHTLRYLYRDVEGDFKHYKTICKMSDFVVEPCDSGSVLTDLAVAQIWGTLQSPVSIHLHLCTREELKAIKRLWKKPWGDIDRYYQSFDIWLASFLRDESIPQNLKDKITQLK